MKCKNWSNKLNNFVVRKLKSFKINGQQQVLSSTMPAMPKEKQTTPISFDENNFDEIKMKEQLNISNTSISVSTASSVSRLLRRCSSNSLQQQNQQCSCQIDDCCPILKTATTDDGCSIQDSFHEYSRKNKQHSCRINQQTNCNCNRINLSSSEGDNKTNNTINATSTNNCNQLYNLGKSNDSFDYSSNISIRERKHSNNCCCSSTSSSKTSPKPTISTTCSIISSTSSPSSSPKSTSSFSLCTATTSSIAGTTPTSSSASSTVTSSNSYNSNSCNCNRMMNGDDQQQKFENKMQYHHYNGDSTTTKIQPTLNNYSNSDSNSKNSGSSSCSSSTTAQSSIVATALAENNTASSAKLTVKSPNNQSQTQLSQQSQQQQPTRRTPNDFIFQKYVGEGSFSTVYHAKEVRTKKEVAIKVCEKTHIIRERKQEYVKREREVMHRMSNCPGFVNLYCTFQDESRLYFVMTFAKNGDLLPHINKVGSFDLECTRHYAAELVLACENMHKRGIVHRDLKPENILLDENMHTLIADFGSSKIIDSNHDMYVTSSLSSQQQQTGLTGTSLLSSSPLSMSSVTATATATTTTKTSISEKNTNSNSSTSRKNSNNVQSSKNYRSNSNSNQRLQNDTENEEAQTRSRRRKCSFVGTAQYVSPELLQDGEITPSCDLWALGCILYQMISGLPPFRGNSEFLIFRQILNLNLEFPEGFDENAEDLVRNLLKLKPDERLGAQDKIGCYESIRTHPFFDGINWDTIRLQQPPTIYPYLPGASKEDELRSQYKVPENLEPGLNDKQLTRLLGLGLMGIEMGDKTEPKNNFNLTETEMRNRLEAQKADKWSAFADGELILRKGFVNKRKGLFARKRMLLLLTGPKLVYIDPVAMVKKGEIPWSPELRVEPKNFKIFFVHTPNRTYYLEDPDGFALKWVNAIENVRQQTYSSNTSNNVVPH